MTTTNVFLTLQEVVLDGLDGDDVVQLEFCDSPRDEPDHAPPALGRDSAPRRAGALVRRALLDPDQYARRFGLPLLPRIRQESGYPLGRMVDILWNALILEGVLAYGMQREAAEILARVMDGIVQNLKRYQAFHPRHDSETGEGGGDRNSLPGLPPLGLFLDTLGVRLISPWRVGIYGENPFPWPVEVRYRGLSVLRDPGRTTVTFPDGDLVEIDDPADCIVER